MKRLLLVAAVVYFFIAPLTYHPDNKVVLKWVGDDYTHVWNIYSHTEKVFGEGGVFNYPPIHFLLAKIEWPLASLVGGSGFSAWLNTSDDAAVFNAHIFRFNAATKLPLILAALVVGWLLYDLTFYFYKDHRRSLLAMGLWFFNPVTIYSIPIMGQNDVLAILLFLISWRVIYSNYWMGIVLFGLSISVKTYPLIWLFFLMLTIPQWKWTKKLQVLVGAYLVNFLTTLPFLSTTAFQKAVMQSSINDRFFIPHIDIGQEESLLIIPIILMGFALAVFLKTSKEQISYGFQSWIILIANLILLGFSHFHPQWFTWMVPFWVLWLVSLDSIKEIKTRVLLTGGLILIWGMIIITFKDKFLTLGLITPFNPNIINMPIIVDFLKSKAIDSSLIVNAAHSALAGMTLFLLTITFMTKVIRNEASKRFQGELATKLSSLAKIGLLTAPSLLILFGFLLSALIPAPIGVLPTSSPDYISFPGTITSPFIAQEDKLNRLDLFLKNPNLGSRDTFSLKLLSQDRILRYSVDFSGFNAGDPSVVRFDFPPILDSKHKSYDLVLTKTATGGAERLELGVDSLDRNEIYFRHYYKPTITPSQVLSKTMQGITTLMQQLWWWYLLVHIGLIFALVKRND